MVTGWRLTYILKLSLHAVHVVLIKNSSKCTRNLIKYLACPEPCNGYLIDNAICVYATSVVIIWHLVRLPNVWSRWKFTLIGIHVFVVNKPVLCYKYGIPSNAHQMHLLQPLEDLTPSSRFQRSEKYFQQYWTGERNISITSPSLQFFGGILFDDLKSSPI